MSQIKREDIEAAKERLGDRNEELIVEMLKPEKYSTERHIGCCPNKAHKDDTPSFSYNGKAHNFLCFGCHLKVDFIDACMMTGMTFLEACDRLFKEADMPMRVTGRGVREDVEYRYPEPEKFEADDKEQVYAYWKRRGISREVVDAAGIRQDKHGNTMFIFYDASETLVGCKLRPSRPVKHGEPKVWWLKDDTGVPYSTPKTLFNMQKVNIASKSLVITCGEGDCLSCMESGIQNVVSIGGGDGNLAWITECWDWLENFDTIVVCPDNDDSGRKFAKEVTRRLGEYRVRIADVPTEAKDAEGNTRHIKDMNELLFFSGTEAVRKAINNAREAEVPALCDFGSIEQFAMEDVDGFTTGFEELDESITKFFVGTLTIITGTAGSGKSSLLSTLIARAVDQGFPAFVYSGELSNQLFHSWLGFAEAGQGHVSLVEKNGRKRWEVDADAIARINKFCGSKIFLYKDGFSPDLDSVLSAAETCVRRNGARLIVIDNMTCLDLQAKEADQLEAQSKMIRRLIAFGNKLQVCIVLVIHPRKQMVSNTELSIYDVSGSSASISLSHRIFSLYRVQEEDRTGVLGKNGHWVKKAKRGDVILRCLKDRYGGGGGRAISLFYDKSSRRFFDTPETLAHRYDWDKDGDADMLRHFDRAAWEADNDDSEVFGT